jgi:hypothetical protein
MQWTSPSGTLRKVPSRSASHGNWCGTGSSRAPWRHERQTAPSRTRSAKVVSRAAAQGQGPEAPAGSLPKTSTAGLPSCEIEINRSGEQNRHA